jgi:hypothetical protein
VSGCDGAEYWIAVERVDCSGAPANGIVDSIALRGLYLSDGVLRGVLGRGVYIRVDDFDPLVLGFFPFQI